SATPSLGAVEFAAPDGPLSGTLTLPGDFATLAEAGDALATRGVIGPTTLIVAGGTYAGPAAPLPLLAGRRPPRPRPVRASEGDAPASDHAATSDADNAVLRLTRPRHLSVVGLTFRPLSPDRARAVSLHGHVEALALVGNTFTAPSGSINQESTALVHG